MHRDLPPQSSADGLFGAVYQELRRLAARYLRGERAGHTLQPTALVNEAYLKIACSSTTARIGDDRVRFLATAARAMRQVLVDHARKHQAQKRGAGRRQITLSEALLETGSAIDALQLHEALEKLAELDERMARIVELRFFSGLRVDEIAAVLGISDRTVDRDWEVARAWLLRSLNGNSPA